MTTALILRCDGRREYIEETVRSTITHLGAFPHQIIVDDSGDPDYGKWLDERFGGFNVVHHEDRRGLGGCFKSACEVGVRLGVDYIFSTEDDQPILTDVSVGALQTVLDAHPYLAQMTLKRGPFNAEEIAAGGLIEASPDLYSEETDGQHAWSEHTDLFSFGPSLIPSSVLWAILMNADVFLEREITDALVPLDYNFAYWGAKFSRPAVSHTGLTRSAGYRW